MQGQNPSSIRYPLVDHVRALAILLMIIFHFSFDLDYFGYVQIDFSNDLFWWSFPRVIVFLFCLRWDSPRLWCIDLPSSGKKFFNRLGKLTLFAALISISTYFLFPNRWIYFGTLHCIATCSLLALPFVRYPRVSLVLALAILVPLLFGYQYPWIKLEHRSLDYIPALPWVAVVLLGIFAHYQGLHRWRYPQNRLGLIFSWSGRHSLKIYLLHQPFLFGVVWLVWTLTRSH